VLRTYANSRCGSFAGMTTEFRPSGRQVVHFGAWQTSQRLAATSSELLANAQATFAGVFMELAGQGIATRESGGSPGRGGSLHNRQVRGPGRIKSGASSGPAGRCGCLSATLSTIQLS
jgi:hypothetical protein